MIDATPRPVLTVTLNPCIDLSLEVPDWQRAEFLRSTRCRRAAGGKGMNVSRVLAALGVPTTAVCVLGGPDAEVYLSLTRDLPFQVAPVLIERPTRTNVVIQDAAGKRRLKVNQPGPRVSASEWRAASTAIEMLMPGHSWLVLSGALPPGVPEMAYARLTRAARRAGLRVAVDCEGGPLRRALAAKPDLVKPNRAELAATLGRSVRSRTETIDAAREIQRAGADIVVVSHGGGECLAVTGSEVWSARPPKIKTGSPVGAGDSLLAGLIAGLLHEGPRDNSTCQSPGSALRLGVACGAASAAEPDTVLAGRKSVKILETRIALRRLI